MPGKVTIKLPDDTTYELEYPQVEVDGLMSTQKVLNPFGEVVIKDITNDYQLTIRFDAMKDQRSSGLMSMIWSSTPEVEATGGQKFRRDLLTIEIEKINTETEEKEIVSQGSGSYLEEIKFEDDAEPFWSINSVIPRIQMVEVDPSLILESDSTKRIDAHHLDAEEWDLAESTKHELEEIQRADKRIRTAAEQRRNE